MQIKVKWKYFSASIPVKENLLDSVVGIASVVVASIVIPVPFIVVFVPSVVVFVPSLVAFVPFPNFENKVLHRTYRHD